MWPRSVARLAFSRNLADTGMSVRVNDEDDFLNRFEGYVEVDQGYRRRRFKALFIAACRAGYPHDQFLVPPVRHHDPGTGDNTLAVRRVIADNAAAVLEMRSQWTRRGEWAG